MMRVRDSVPVAACLLVLVGQTRSIAQQPGDPPATGADPGDPEVVEVEVVSVSEESGWQDSFVRDERVVNALTAQTVRKNALLLVVVHRARQSFAEGQSSDFLGLDAGGLKVGLGLRYGVLDNLDAGVFRLNGTAEAFDTYEFDTRYRFLDRHRHPLNVALRAGLSWFVQPDAGDASGAFVQLLADRRFGPRVKVGAGVLYHGDSSGDRKSTGDEDESFAVQGCLELRLTDRLAWVMEATANVGGYGEERPAASGALKAFTYGHTFSLVVSNTQYVAADGIVADSWRDWDEPIIGFNITRELRL